METKRKLKKEEIKKIVSFLKPNTEIPFDIANYHVKKETKNLAKQLEKIEVYPKTIPYLSWMIQNQYYSSMISPGESVGISLAQSVGEKQTQGALNTFHKAGSFEKQSVTSSFLEILNATKNPKSPIAYIYTNDSNDSIEELREKVGNSLVHITFKKVIEKYEIFMEKKQEKWYDLFLSKEETFEKEWLKYPCLSLKLNKEILYRFKIRIENLSKIVHDKFSEIYCIDSPECFGQLDIFVDVKNIELPEEIASASITDEKMYDLYIYGVVLKKIEEINICGIQGIEDIYFQKESDNEWCEKEEKNDKWMIVAILSRIKVKNAISRYKQILSLKFVNSEKTYTNNIWVILHTYGIEACRSFMIKEFTNLVPAVNKCHITLLVSKMTQNGTISSISRYSMRTGSTGPLGRASFEETLENFVSAATYGEIDNTNGVSASIICGKKGRFGTGLSQIKFDTEMTEV